MGWSGWQDLGDLESGLNAGLASDVTAIARGGSIDCFARFTDNYMYWATYDGTTWQRWRICGSSLISDIAAISLSPSGFDCLARDKHNELVHAAWEGVWTFKVTTGSSLLGDLSVTSTRAGEFSCFSRSKNDRAIMASYADGTWSQWTHLGGDALAGEITAVSWAEDRIDCFARSTNNRMIHWWHKSNFWEREDLGGELIGDISVVSWGPYRLDCFARGSHNQMMHRYYDENGWSSWIDCGGTLVGSGRTRDRVGDITAVSWGPRRIDCFGRRSDTAAVHDVYDGTSWKGWEDLGGEILGEIAVVTRRTGTLDCFARGVDGHMKWNSYSE